MDFTWKCAVEMCCIRVYYISGGSTYKGSRRVPPPTGPNSFVFTYVFTKKHLCQRLAPPPMRVGAPPTGNPGSAPVYACQLPSDGIISIALLYRIFGIAFCGIICVRTVVRFPAIIIKVRKILDKSDKMNLFSILQFFGLYLPSKMFYYFLKDVTLFFLQKIFT